MKAITKLNPGTYVFCADGFFGFHSPQDNVFKWLGCWYKERGSDVISLTASEKKMPAANSYVPPSDQCSITVAAQLANNEGKYTFNDSMAMKQMDKLVMEGAIKQLSNNRLGLTFASSGGAIILRRSNKATAQDPRLVAEEHYEVSLPFLDKNSSEPVVVYHESAEIAKHLVGLYEKAGFAVKQVETYEAFEAAMSNTPKFGSKL